MLKYDLDSRTITIVGTKGRRKQAALEDKRHAVTDNILAIDVQEALDKVSKDVLDAIRNSSPDNESDNEPHNVISRHKMKLLRIPRYLMLNSECSASFRAVVGSDHARIKD